MSGYNDHGNNWDDRDTWYNNEEDQWTELDVDKVVAETDLAILVKMDGNDIWLPKSQLDDWPDVGDSGTIIIKTWLAEEKELI